MKKILIYSILLFALCSCDNFLEEDPRGKLTPSSFFSSPEDLDMAITGMYNKYYQTNALKAGTQKNTTHTSVGVTNFCQTRSIRHEP